MRHDERTHAAHQHAPDEHLHHRDGGDTQDLAQHQPEGADRRDDHFEHPVVLLLDDRLHDHRTVNHQEHIEDHTEHEPHDGRYGRRIGLLVAAVVLHLVVAEDLHIDRSLHLVENLRQIFDVIVLEFLLLDDVGDLPRHTLLDQHRRGAVGIELHVAGIGHYVPADPEYAETVGMLSASLVERQVGRLIDHLLAALEPGSDHTALVDHGNMPGFPLGIAHDERRGHHQTDHQHRHKNRGHDERLLAHPFVEFPGNDNSYLRICHGFLLLLVRFLPITPR